MTEKANGWMLACAAGLVLGACGDGDKPCLPTATQSCECDGGDDGVQVCVEGGTWEACDCTGTGLPGAPTGGSSGGSSSPSSRDASTSSGGSGGTAGGNIDGGSAVDGGPGGGATDASDDSADGSTDAAAGDGGIGTYGPCMPDGGAADSCAAGETCRTSLGGTTGVCAADCEESSECVAPPGDYEATPECGGDNTCRLNCAPTGAPPFPRSCPDGMTCRLEFGSQSCYPN